MGVINVNKFIDYFDVLGYIDHFERPFILCIKLIVLVEWPDHEIKDILQIL